MILICSPLDSVCPVFQSWMYWLVKERYFQTQHNDQYLQKNGSMSKICININDNASKTRNRLFRILTTRNRGSLVSQDNMNATILSHELGTSLLPYFDIFGDLDSIRICFRIALKGCWCQHRTPTNRLITNLRQNRHPFRGYLEKGHFDDIFVTTRSKYHKTQNIITN